MMYKDPNEKKKGNEGEGGDAGEDAGEESADKPGTEGGGSDD